MKIRSFQRTTEASFPDNDALPKKKESTKKFDKRFNEWWDEVRVNLARLEDQVTKYISKDLQDGLSEESQQRALQVTSLDEQINHLLSLLEGTVQEVQGDLSDTQTDLSELTNLVNQLSTDLTTTQTNLSTTQTSLATTQQELSDLTTFVNSLLDDFYSTLEGGDTDGDGVPDRNDAFPNDASESTDTDGDGAGDNTDYFYDDANYTQTKSDLDAYVHDQYRVLTVGDIIKWIVSDEGVFTTGEYYILSSVTGVISAKYQGNDYTLNESDRHVKWMVVNPSDQLTPDPGTGGGGGSGSYTCADVALHIQSNTTDGDFTFTDLSGNNEVNEAIISDGTSDPPSHTTDQTWLGATSIDFANNGNRLEVGDKVGDYYTKENFKFLHDKSSEYTIEGWIYRNQQSGSSDTILSNAAFTSYVGIRVRFLSASPDKLTFTICNSGSISFEATTATTIPKNDWVHYAICYDGTNIKCYIDGDISKGFSQSWTNSVSTSAATQVLWIGARNATGYDRFHGYMQDIRISKKAIYTGDFTPPTSLLSNLCGGTNGINGSATYTTPLTLSPSDTELDFIWAEPGTFTMGTDDTYYGNASGDNFNPEHTVVLTSGFYLGKYEVTQAQYEAVMTGNSNGLDSTPVNTPSQIGNNKPVASVSWDDIQLFLQTINSNQSLPSGWEYVLPTEAEWEYCCRAGTTTRFSWGSAYDSTKLWVPSGVGDYPPDVGSCDPNPWGFYDMHGSSGEWVSDWFQRDHSDDLGNTIQSGDTRTDPQGPPTGMYSNTHKTIKGLHGDTVPLFSAAHFTRTGTDKSTDNYTVGFRLAIKYTGV